jgi:hypothetical protein
MWIGMVALFDVQECIQIEDGQSQLAERVFAQELRGQPLFLLVRQSSGGQQKRPIDLSGGILTQLTLQPLGPRTGQTIGKLAIEQFQRLRHVRTLLAARTTRLRRRLIEDLEKRQPEIPFGDQIDRTSVMLAWSGVVKSAKFPGKTDLALVCDICSIDGRFVWPRCGFL